VLVDGERESVVRPRVRKYGEDGNSNEVVLSTYEPAAIQFQNEKLRMALQCASPFTPDKIQFRET
jgi:hypothetical protein